MLPNAYSGCRSLWSRNLDQKTELTSRNVPTVLPRRLTEESPSANGRSRYLPLSVKSRGRFQIIPGRKIPVKEGNVVALRPVQRDDLCRSCQPYSHMKQTVGIADCAILNMRQTFETRVPFRKHTCSGVINASYHGHSRVR